jgi:Cu/Ag efflux protein CusF
VQSGSVRRIAAALPQLPMRKWIRVMLHRSFALFLPLALNVVLYGGTAAAQVPVPLGIDLGSSGPVNARGGEGHPGAAEPNRPVQMAHDGRSDVHGTGTVNSVDAAAHKVNITHQPIPQIGWPTMTMDFAVAPAVDLGAIKTGSQIEFGMDRGADGMYVIQSISTRPASGQPAATPPASGHRGH